LQLPSFDALSPFGPDNTHTSLMTHFSTGGAFSRRRFVHALAANDSHVLLDGGWMLSLGEEDNVRTIVEIFRQLPAAKFTEVTSARREATQPVVVRKATHNGKTYIYAVNDSRWPVTAAVEFETPRNGDVQALDRNVPPAIQRQGENSNWNLQLAPYDLQAIVLPSDQLRVSDLRVKLDSAVTSELANQVVEIRSRANSLRNPKAITVLQNPGFELAAKNQPLPGWVHARANGVTIAPDTSEYYGSKQSLLMRSSGPVAWVRSDPFPVPSTGRLAMWVWLKVRDPNQQPPLRLSIEGKLDGKTYYHFAPVGTGKDAVAVQNTWRQFRFQVTDLPPHGLTDLRIGFDMMGAGEVWIDDVQLFDMWFFNHERDELLKRIAAADYQLEQGAVSDCAKFLESYWPRLLAQQIPLQPRLANIPAPPIKSPSTEPPPASDTESKTWRFIPKSLRPF
jgi:hypothetical protein